jgi:hypothetical protein
MRKCEWDFNQFQEQLKRVSRYNSEKHSSSQTLITISHFLEIKSGDSLKDTRFGDGTWKTDIFRRKLKTAYGTVKHLA